MKCMKLARVIETSAAVAATSSRTAKVAALAGALREASVEGDSDSRLIEVVCDYLAGALPQRRVGVGWRGLRDLPEPADRPRLSVQDTDEALSTLAALSGTGSATKRRKIVRRLFARATAAEQRWLVSLMTGQMRQGASDGVMLLAIARAANVEGTVVRAAVMRAGFAGQVARVALTAADHDEATARLAAMTLRVGRPLRPMLAASATTVVSAVSGTHALAVERKVDGIRIQAHIWAGPQGRHVEIFTRTLEEITDRVPEVVEALERLSIGAAVFDGEIIAQRPDGRPHPFQVTGARTASSSDPDRQREEVPLTTYLFDVMHQDGNDLLDLSAEERWAVLSDIAPDLLVPRIVTADPRAAQTFFDAQVSAGHEGVIVKDLDMPYSAGRRGAGWVKVKPRHTLDLVVTAVEWGSGRRRGQLSNLHLACRNEDSADLVMLGKTFKGMTDDTLKWQTARFLELETHRNDHVVYVRPVQVVEIAIDGVQRSRRYGGGTALRFARVLRYRDDKSVDEIDSLQGIITTCPP